ncbi:WXG100 family type VII secretion target [Streptomyces sp. NPDC058740]|uniref:WXG100 family type VII secretion target n=1 Tax=Streptomyces sp. NPDC058740 TaxID=3346619 RepID=UPI00369DE185
MSGKPEVPKAKETPLEGLSNEQLLAMLTPLKNGKADQLSQKLKSAGSEIFAIGSELRLRAGLLRWEGEGADAFREWAGATGLATMKLGQYATKAGECLSDVSQAITEASSGVESLAKSSAAAKTNYANAQKTLYAANHDPDAGPTAKKDASADMTAAAATREATRVEAMMKLRSLGQTYTHSGTQINNEPVPEFPPPAGYLGNAWVTPQSYKQLPGGTSRTSRSTSSGHTTGERSRTTGSSDGSVVGHTDTGTAKPSVPHDRGVVVPDQEVDLGIDHTTITPERPTTPTGPTGTVPPSRPEGPTYPSIISTVPPTYPSGGGSQRGTVPPPLGGGGGKTISGGRGITGPALTGPGGTASARMPRDTGITGGRAVPQSGGRPKGGIPRSTVIGAEGGGTGRAPMAGGQMGHGGTGGKGGTVAGRRLAGETGGVVGGRAAQRPGQVGGRPFTPGGTGLVRGGQPGSGGPGAGQGRPVGGLHGAGARTGDDRDEERRDGERPDYLTEDEETWQQGSRRVVPPVVD